MIRHDRCLTLMLVGFGPLLAASCLGEAYLEGVKLFPDSDTSSSGSDEASEPTTAPTTSTSAGETGIQTATGAVDEDAGSTGSAGTSTGPETGAPEATGDAVNQPPEISGFEANAYFFDAAGPLTLTLDASDDHAVVKVDLYLDDEEIESNLTLADFPYVYEVLSAKYNGDQRTFKVVVEDAEGLTADAVTMPIKILLPDPGVERCFFEDPDKGSVISVITAIEYTPEAIFAVGTRALKLAVWKLDPNDCHLLPGWPKSISSWTGEDEFKGLTSLGAAVDEDEDGNIVVGGNFLVNGKPQAYAALLTDEGARLWEKAGAPGDELAGVAAGIGLHSNRVFVGGSMYTSDNPVRTDAAIWIYHYDGEGVFVALPTTLRAPFTPDELDEDKSNELNERVRAIVVHPTAGHALAVGERDFVPNNNEFFSRTFAVQVHPTGGVLGVPWTSPANGTFVHDAGRSVAVCEDGFLVGGWTRDEPPDAEPNPMIFWFDENVALKQHRAELQLFATQIHGIDCDRENKIVSAGSRHFGSDDARVFSVLGLIDSRVTYDSGAPGNDTAGAVACDLRGFCGWGGFRTADMMPYAVVRVHHP